jgi:hypothetical protein
MKEKKGEILSLFKTQISVLRNGKFTLITSILMKVAFITVKIILGRCNTPSHRGSQTHNSGHNCIYLHDIYANMSVNSLTPELNPSAQRCLPRIFFWRF